MEHAAVHKSLKNLRIASLGATSLLLLSGVCSCSKSPEGVLDQEKMAQLMADIHMAEAVVDFNYGEYATDSARQAFKQSVYLRHGVDQYLVDSSLTWYGHHIEDYIKVYDRTIEILEERKDEYASASNGHIAVAGDSVHVWTGPGHISVSPLVESRMLSFSLEPDSTWQTGDVYTLSFKTVNNLKPLKSRLLVDYANGTTAYADDHSTQKSVTNLTLQIDSTQQAERIYGYIAIPKDDLITYEIDSIMLTRIRKHLNPDAYYPSRVFRFGKTGADTRNADEAANASDIIISATGNNSADKDMRQRGFATPSQQHEAISSTKRELPAPSADTEHTSHRQGAAEHRVTDRRENAARRQSAMPRRQAPTTRQPARSRQMAPEK